MNNLGTFGRKQRRSTPALDTTTPVADTAAILKHLLSKCTARQSHRRRANRTGYSKRNNRLQGHCTVTNEPILDQNLTIILKQIGKNIEIEAIGTLRKMIHDFKGHIIIRKKIFEILYSCVKSTSEEKHKGLLEKFSKIY